MGALWPGLQIAGGATQVVGSGLNLWEQTLAAIQENKNKDKGLQMLLDLANGTDGKPSAEDKLTKNATDLYGKDTARAGEQYGTNVKGTLDATRAYFGNDAVQPLDEQSREGQRRQLWNTIGGLDPTKSKLTTGVREETGKMVGDITSMEEARDREMQDRVNASIRSVGSEYSDVKSMATGMLKTVMDKSSVMFDSAQTAYADTIKWLNDSAAYSVASVAQPFIASARAAITDIDRGFGTDVVNNPQVERQKAAIKNQFAQQMASVQSSERVKMNNFIADARTKAAATRAAGFESAVGAVVSGGNVALGQVNDALKTFATTWISGNQQLLESGVQKTSAIGAAITNATGAIIDSFMKNTDQMNKMIGMAQSAEDNYYAESGAADATFAANIAQAIMQSVGITAQAASALLSTQVSLVDFMGPGNTLTDIANNRFNQRIAQGQLDVAQSNATTARWGVGASYANAFTGGLGNQGYASLFPSSSAPKKP